MAFSQSFKRGQAPATCNFCEEETKIKWKCTNCDVLMCDKCKDKIHAKLKNSKDHNVIDIKEVGIYRGEQDFSVLKCVAHTGQSAVMFCTTCDRLVCTTCISKLHNGHGLVEIAEGCNSKVEKIKNEQTKAKEKIMELTREIGTISLVDMKDSERYKDLIRKIDAQNIEIKKLSDKHAEKLKSELKKKWTDFQEEKVSKARKTVDNLQKLSSNAEDIIQYNNAENIFIECEKLSTAVSIAAIDPGTISFLPGQISPYNMGSLQVVSNAVNVRIVKQFQTEISRVDDLVSICPDNSLWISDGDVLQKVKPVEQKLKIESTFNIYVICVAITPTGDLLLSSDGSIMKQISGKTGHLTDSVYDTHPFKIISAVHVTKAGKVIVGVKRGISWPVTGRRAMIVMNQKGEHETIYEHDKNNFRIFTYVKSITSTDNGNMCVVDKLSEDKSGRVVVLNRDGDILQIYTGHHEVNKENEPFKPAYIVTTPSDNIIVNVLGSDILHILNNCGHLITHFNMRDLVVMTYSLGFTRTAGQLYIGCTRGVGSSEKAKLYEVHISGC